MTTGWLVEFNYHGVWEPLFWEGQFLIYRERKTAREKAGAKWWFTTRIRRVEI